MLLIMRLHFFITKEREKKQNMIYTYIFDFFWYTVEEKKKERKVF